MSAVISFAKCLMFWFALMFVQKISTESLLEDKFMTILVEHENREKRSVLNEMPETLSIMIHFDGQSYPSTVYLVSSEVSDYHVDEDDEKDYGVYKLIDENNLQFFVIEKVEGRYHVVQAYMSIKGKTYEVQPDIYESALEKRERRELGKLKLKDFSDDLNEEKDSPELSGVLKSIMKKKKRAAEETGRHHTVELCMIVDFSVFEHWSNYEQIRKRRVLRRMKAHYSYIFQIARVPYDLLQFPDGKTIELSVGYFEIIQNVENAIIAETTITNVDGLDALSDHITGNNIIGCDVSTLFTRADFRTPGVANFARGCTIRGTCMVHDLFQAVNGHTLAHEVGHNLNAQDDFLFGCSDYVMSSSRQISIPYSSSDGQNRWLFSNCSRDSISIFLDNRACMLPENTNLPNVFPVRPLRFYGGQRISLDEQCARFFNNRESTFCSDMENSYHCLGMYCFDPSSSSCERNVIPLEGSPCNTTDPSFICVHGLCRQECLLIKRACRGLLQITERLHCRRRYQQCRSLQQITG